MTAWDAGFMPSDRQLFDRTIGETIARLVRDRYPRDTAKVIARKWQLEPTTAANLIKGHASERTITKALKAEGWDLLEAIGHALTGQTHHEWEERKLSKIIEEAERAEQGIRSLRARREELAQRAAGLDPDLARKIAGGNWRANGDAGASSDRGGAEEARPLDTPRSLRGRR